MIIGLDEVLILKIDMLAFILLHWDKRIFELELFTNESLRCDSDTVISPSPNICLLVFEVHPSILWPLHDLILKEQSLLGLFNVTHQLIW